MGDFVEIIKYEENNFKPVVVFKSWRVAVLNYFDYVSKEGLKMVEKHPETDEVFVLTKGEAFLIVGDDSEKPKDLSILKMEAGVVYNIKANVWHFIAMSTDCSVLLVENSDTSVENTGYCDIDPQELKELKDQIVF